MSRTLVREDPSTYKPLPNHIPALDGLRGLSAYAVMFAHCSNAGYLPRVIGLGGFGQVGVATFFALSGFLMAHVTFGKTFTTDNVWRYFRARTSRVVPLYYFTLAVSLFSFIVLGNGFYNNDSLTDLLLASLALYGEDVLWSIPVELQFYILFLVIWFAARAGKFLQIASLLAVGAIVVGTALSGYLETSKHLPFWLHFFLIGITMRWLMDDGSRNRLSVSIQGSLAHVLGWTIVALAIFANPGLRMSLGLSDYENHLDPVAIGILPLLLWACCANIAPLRWLGAKIFVFMGMISFSVYLVHSPVIRIARMLGISEIVGPLGAAVFVVAASTVISVISYRLIEVPGKRLTTQLFARARPHMASLIRPSSPKMPE